MIIVEIAGHLGADPEVRFTPAGLKVTTMRVATNVRRKGKEETVWWRVTIWGDRFDKMMPYFKKGSAVLVIGEMHPPEIWEKEGRQTVTLELTADIVRFSPFGKPTAQEGAAPPYGQPARQPQSHDYAYSESSAYGSSSAAFGGGSPSPTATTTPGSLSGGGKFDGGFGSYASDGHEEDHIPF